jgi:hypothetical protein
VTLNYPSLTHCNPIAMHSGRNHFHMNTEAVKIIKLMNY